MNSFLQKNTDLAIKAAAWFFVKDSNGDEGIKKQVPIVVPFKIGRAATSDLPLQCASVSGSHAEIVEFEGQLCLVDLDSTNGTFLNGIRINGRHPLKANDTVQFGTIVFQISGALSKKSDSELALNGELPEESSEKRFQRLFSDGVVPFYQPVITLDGDASNVIGYEVLGRSRLFGLRTPAQMFAAASRHELESELSRTLRKRGIEVGDKRLPEDLTLFVNTHPAELLCAGLEESLFEIRECHPNRPIMIEVHESIMNDAQTYSKLRATLENLNIQLAFHDFGGGQVRLAELCKLSPDLVKFDVELIRGIDRANKKHQTFVESLVNMLSNMGITSHAECIEQEGERDTLRQLGFQLGQGFLFGRPSSIGDCSQSIEQRDPSEPSVKSFIPDAPNPATNSEPTPSKPEPQRELAEPQSLTPSGPNDGDWLMSQPGQMYTVQVLSAISKERALAHIAAEPNPEQFAVFCKQGKTRKLFIVVYGVFNDRTEAKAAVKSLSNSAVSPWIRMLSSVQADICKE